MEEAELRNRLARAAPALGTAPRPDFATLARVRQALGPDEALLSFQIAPWEDARGGFAGGSWLLAVSRAGTRVYRLPGRGELRSAVRLFNGTFEPRNGADAAPAAGLYRQLLERPSARAAARRPAADLDPGRRAPPAPVRGAEIVEPGAAAGRALRAVAGAIRDAVAELAATPAARRAYPGPGARRSAHARRGSQPAAGERGAVFAAGTRLGPLPFARRESRAVVGNLGGGSVRRSARTLPKRS